MRVYNNLIIGGGASGLMLGANLKDKKSTLILEHNSKLGAKILISGGGRCNFTNKVINSSKYLAKKSFIKSFLKEYPTKSILEYFTKRGVEFSIKDSTQYFCKSSSKELLDVLLKEIKGVEVQLNTKVLEVNKNEYFEVKTTRGLFFTKRLIVASGGLSFPKLGATSIGYEIAKKFGHSINKTNPALVGFTLQPSEAFFKELSGVSLDIELKVNRKTLSGSMLFAHRGVSGPVILDASLFWQKGQIEINFLPNFDLSSVIDSKKSISNLLPLPKRVATAFLKRLDIKDKRATLLSKDEFKRLEILQKYSFAPAGTFGYNKAEITKGGVCVDEISQFSFESKLEKNLYFLGEVLDVSGMLGGYNFHFAFSSALSCAKHINN